MSPNILKEVEFLLLSVALGVFVTFVYDWLRIFRLLLPHKNWVVSAEDLLFWCFCFMKAFSMLYQENNGVLRWFAVLGAAIGMFIYKWLFGRFFVKTMGKLLAFLLHYLKKGAAFLISPITFTMKKLIHTGKRAGRRSKGVLRILKKRLTSRIKEVKMMLCKQ